MKKQLFLSVIVCLCFVSCGKLEKPESVLLKYNFKSADVTVDGYRLHYFEAGESTNPPLVLIHGWGAWSGHWKNIIPLLAKNFHVYALDRIGNGLSDKPLPDKFSYTTDDEAKLYSAFITALRYKQVNLVGHSLGGEIAMKTALYSPEKINHLVLIAALGLKENINEVPCSVKYFTKINVNKMIKAMSNPNDLANYWMLRRYLFYYENNIDFDIYQDINSLNLNTIEGRTAVATSASKAMFGSGINEQLKNYTGSVLLIWGENDRIVPVSMGEKYNMLLKNSTLVVLPKTGHLDFMQQPVINQYIIQLNNFLKW